MTEAFAHIPQFADSRFIDVNGQRIHYLEAGHGQPLLLLHGWLCWGAYWRKIFAKLAQNFRVIAPDLPGHGLSEKNSASYSTDAQAKVVAGFIAALGLGQAHVAGHSMGGEIAAKLAIRAPLLVKKISLICAAGLEGAAGHLPFYVRVSRQLGLESVLGSLMSEWMIRLFVKPLMFHPQSEVPDEFIRDVVVANLRADSDRQAMVRVTREGLFQSYIDSECAQISHPTLVISASHDRIVVPEVGLKYARLIGNARHVLFARSGHMLPWEQAEELADMLTGHFS